MVIDTIEDREGVARDVGQGKLDAESMGRMCSQHETASKM